MPRLLCVLLAAVLTVPVLSQVQLRDRVDRAVQREHLGQFWGVAAARIGDERVALGYGLRAPDARDPIDADDLFDVGSVTKLVTALAVVSLVEDGVLGLSDTVREHVPGVPDDAAPVTIEQLLSHSAGLDDGAALQRLDFPDRDEAVRLALAAPRLFEPGASWRYSNAGFVVLAAVIEHATGDSYESVARERVLRPAGMLGSGFLDGLDASGEPLDSGRFTARRIEPARGQRTERGLLDDGYGWGLRGAGGLLSSANDLLRFGEAFLGGRIVDRPGMDDMLTRRAAGSGIGWFLGQASQGSRVISHGGSTRGFQADFRLYPDDDAAVVVLTNTRAPAWTLAQSVERAVFGGGVPRAGLELWVGELDLGQTRLARIEQPAFSLVREDDSIVLGLEHDDRIVARLELNEAAAESALRAIRALRGTNDPPGDEPGSTLVIATFPYTPGRDGLIEVTPGETDFAVLGGYRGTAPDGSPVHDERVLLRVIHTSARFWPILWHIGDVDAERLARELVAVLEQPPGAE